MRTWLTRPMPSGSMTVGVLLTITVAVLFVVNPSWLQRLDLLMSDLRFRVRGPKQPGPEVVIAAIDEKSIDKLGRWPWPYTVQAQLVDRLTAYGAKVIGYDVVFSSSDTSAGIDNLRAIKGRLLTNGQPIDPKTMAFLDQAIANADHDRIFAEALRRSGRTVLGYFFHFSSREVAHLSEKVLAGFLESIRNGMYNAVHTQGQVSLRRLPLPTAWAVESNIPMLAQAAVSCGFFSNASDADGAFRRYAMIVKYRHDVEMSGAQDVLFAPLSLQVLERYVGGETAVRITPVGVGSVGIHARHRHYTIPTDDLGYVLINHLGPGGTFPRYSVVDILEGDSAAPASAFKGKIVLVGATAVAVEDLRVTPFDPVLPGVELHAAVLDNVLQQDFLIRPWWGKLYTLGSILVLGTLLTFLLYRLGALGSSLVFVVLLVGSAVLNYTLFTTAGLWLNIVFPPLATVVVAGGITVYRYAVEEKNSRFVRKTFETYLSPALIEQMIDSKAEPKLGGDSGLRTAYFTDIASFSSFAEILTPTELVELLNEYLTAMTDILLKEGGTLDKYEGDAILAFFGAPLPMPDHATRALRTALAMQGQLASLRQKWAAENKWPDLVQDMRMRIGINSGEFVTGNMGSHMRMDYTMMGDAVNTAARLESAAKLYGVYILCTWETLELAGPDAFEWRTLDRVKVVGRTEPLDAVEVLAFKDDLAPEHLQMCQIYQQGLELYRQQQWDEAKAKFAESEKLEDMFPHRLTNPSRVYIERCGLFKARPPGADWDGVWILTSK
jgi:adenylate cyclase